MGQDRGGEGLQGHRLSEWEFVAVGRVISPWGVGGEVKVEVMTEFPQRFLPGERMYVDRRAVIVERSRGWKGGIILKLEGVNSRQEAERLRGRLLEVEQGELYPLSEGQYYQFQILGLEVWTTQGELLGRVDEIMPTGSNDVYLVRGERGELLLPAIEDVVKKIDLGGGRMVVEVIEGLLNYRR